MKILAFVGSPRKDGNTAKLVNVICQEAEKNGHICKTTFVYDLNPVGCKACGACKEGEVEYCAQDDVITHLMPEIAAADCLILASPIYMGYITGPMKTFIDRFYTFVQKAYKTRILNDKQIVLVMTCGAPANVFEKVMKDLEYWFTQFFKMKLMGKLFVGELSNGNIPEEALKKAKEIGGSL